MAVENINPDATSNPNQWFNIGGANKVASVTDAIDANYIIESTLNEIQRFTLVNPAGIGPADKINSVKTFFRAQETDATEKLNLKIRSSQVIGINKNTDAADTNLSRRWVNYNGDTFIEKPGGGGWDLAALNSLEIEIKCTAVESFQSVKVTRFYAVIDYTSRTGAWYLLLLEIQGHKA